MPDDAKLRVLEGRIDALERKLTRSQHALSVSLGLTAGLAHVLAMEFPAGRAQLETALIDAMDEAANDPVTLEVLKQIMQRLSG